MYTKNINKTFIRLLALIGTLGFLAIVLYADNLEVENSNLGVLAWGFAYLVGAASLYFQARRSGIEASHSAVISIFIVLIPFLNLLLVPLVGIILAVLPTKKETKTKTLKKEK